MHTPFPIEVLPERVISLVPSITESMFELGLGKWMVGCTDYCMYPKKDVESLAKVGGPKHINTDLIVQLNPALVLANREENSLEDITILEEQGIPVWGAFPLTVRDAMDDLWGLAGLFQSDHAARIVRSLEDSLDWLKASIEEQPKISYFCPIWKDTFQGGPRWMTFNQATYMSDLLSLFGGINIFGDFQQNNTDDEKKKRYPMISMEQVLQKEPNLIILPDEPYRFSEQDRNSFLDIFQTSKCAPVPQVKLVEGAMIMWHGTRLARAFDCLPELFSASV
jgi:iron complex transport system substrate-binding protein